MLWFMARDTANGGIEQRDNAVLDVICLLTADATGRGWLSWKIRLSLASFRKCVNSSSPSRRGAFGNNAFLSRTP